MKIMKNTVIQRLCKELGASAIMQEQRAKRKTKKIKFDRPSLHLF
jgi:hypothetical protein